MNIRKIREYIVQYKERFEDISKKEIFKWKAIQCFQEHWNIEADDFCSMLKMSLESSKNLLDSGKYFPRRMLLFCAEKEPEMVRELFHKLFDEDEDLIERIRGFQKAVKFLVSKYKNKKSDYQDHRAVMVYLNLRFPERYYIYKFRIFKEVVTLIDYPYKAKSGAIQNILEFITLCDTVKAEIVKDQELLGLHKNRLTNAEYFDYSYNVLTQDILYAAVRHLKELDTKYDLVDVFKRLKLSQELKQPKKLSPNINLFRGTFTNHVDNQKENKRIGDQGELLVLEYETEKVKKAGFSKKPEHMSKSEGDGLGYDILSYDENGDKIFIEVKTTTGGFDTPFFITQNELRRSEQEGDKFYLYRLFNFDTDQNQAEFIIKKGSIAKICTVPVLFKAII